MSRRAAAVAALNHLMQRGLRPRDWDGLSAGRLEGVADGCPASVEANLLLYYRHLDRGEPAQAAAYLNRLPDVGEQVAPAFQAELAVTAAYFAARHVGDAQAARAWLEWAPAGGTNPVLQAQAEAAVLVAEGRFSAARDAAEAGLMNLREGLLGGLSSVPADALRDLLDESVAALPAPPLPVAAVSVPAGEGEPAPRPGSTPAAAHAAPKATEARPTLWPGMAIALVASVTLVIAVMPLPHGGSLRLRAPDIGPTIDQPGSADDAELIDAICPNGCPGQVPIAPAQR